MPENYANSFITDLDGGIDASQTTITVLSIVGAPDPVFRFRIDDEILEVTAVAGLDYTVVRGTEGTTAASHASGAAATAILSAAAIDGIRASLFASDSLANVGDFQKPGQMIFITDGVGTVPRQNGTTFDHYGPIFPMDQPILSDFTQVNSPIVKEVGGTINLNTLPVSGGIFRGLARTYTGPKSFRIAFKHFAFSRNYTFAGLFFYNSSTGRMTGIGRNQNNFDGGAALEGIRMNNPNSYNSSPLGIQTYSGFGELVWFHLEDDNTDLKFYYSMDGVNRILMHTEARTTWVTPNSIFIGISCDTTSTHLMCQMSLLSYTEG